jgi:hypothetical protein
MFIGGFVAMAATVPLGLVSSSGPPAASVPLGDYAGANDPGGITSFGAATGTHPTLATDYLDRSSGWGAMSSAGYLGRWAGSGYRLVLGVPMIPSGTGGTLAAGASGAYDSNFVTLAHNLVAQGLSDAVLRVGWEFNGNWYPWAVQSGADAANFAAYWRHIVDAMRSVPGAQFLFDWNPTGYSPTGYSPDQAYPGDAYVDYVGTDVYDNCWCSPQTPPNAWSTQLGEQWGLNWLAGFAAAHGKAIAFPEWSVDFRHDGHGLGDDPSFMNSFATWIASHNVAFTNIFSFDAPDQQISITDGSFPYALAAFRANFGGASATLGSRPAPAPPPPLVVAGPPPPPVVPGAVASAPHVAFVPRPAPPIVALPAVSTARTPQPGALAISALMRALAEGTPVSRRSSHPVTAVTAGYSHRVRTTAPARPSSVRVLSMRPVGSGSPFGVNLLGLCGMFLLGGLLGLGVTASRVGRRQPKHAIHRR